MQITRQYNGDLLELGLEGMLDSESAAYLRGAVDEAVRDGWHKIVVNLQSITFLSSAGIGVLLHCCKQLQGIRGFFSVCDPSPQVEQVLRLTKLAETLIRDRDTARSVSVTGAMTRQTMSRIASQAGINFEIYSVASDSKLQCRVVGTPDRLLKSGFSAEHCHRVAFPESTIGLGLGAFGSGFQDCRARFGEFLAVAGCAAQLPTHTFGVPDYLLEAEQLVPEVEVLYGVKCEGAFARLLRFHPVEKTETVKFSNLVDQCLSLAQSEIAGLVIIAECAGLVGAALRRSPALDSASPDSRFQYPAIREWISFSCEQVHRHSLAVMVGVAARKPPGDGAAALAPLLRPLRDAAELQGHFHAAVFPYRPLKKRSLELQELVRSLFDSGELQAVVHLLSDQRPISGAGETELVGGACWISPIHQVAVD